MEWYLLYYCKKCNRETVKPICSKCGLGCIPTGYDEHHWLHNMTEEDRNRIRRQLSKTERPNPAQLILSTTDTLYESDLDYLGIVSGSFTFGIAGLVGEGILFLESNLSTAKDKIHASMIAQAAGMGADAVVGVSYNLLSGGPANNTIIVVGSGTAVKKKNK